MLRGVCGIRACVRECEGDLEGGLRCRTAFKGSGRGVEAIFRVGVVCGPR
nr:MAG TPA: hypothetical protein [Caudoviricetes sp.]